MVRVKNTINPNHFQQRSTTAAARQTDSTHVRGPTQPRLSSDPGSNLIKFGLKCRVLREIVRLLLR